MNRSSTLSLLAVLIITATGCWPYPLVSSKQAEPDNQILGRWKCTDLVNVKEEDTYQIHDVAAENIFMNFELATVVQHNEKLPKHVMLYHPESQRKLSFTPPFIIGDTPKTSERVYCWSASLKGNRYLVFQFFEGPIQTDLSRRKDPEFLIYRYQITDQVLQMYDLSEKVRERIGRRLGMKKDTPFSPEQMQTEILKIRDGQWDLHVRAHRA